MMASVTWQLHDFTSSARELTASEARRFHTVSTTLGAAISSRLSAFVCRPLSAELRGADVVDFSTVGDDTELPIRAYLVRSDDPRAEHVITISAELLVALVDTLLGSTRLATGGGIPDPTSSRTLTALEDDVAEAAIQEVLLAEADVWNLRTPPRVDRHVDDPRLLEVRRRDDAVALARYHVRLGDRRAVGGVLQVAVPPGDLLLQLSGVPRENDIPTFGAVGAKELSLRVELRSAPLHITDLIALRPGALIDTGIDATAPVALKIGDKPLEAGRIGRRAGRLAVRITGPDRAPPDRAPPDRAPPDRAPPGRAAAPGAAPAPTSR